MKTRKTPPRVFRIARRPNPWHAPDWSQSNPDGTFGNRFDDPLGYYRVLYASSQKVSCFIETLARFRPDLTLLAEFRDIDEPDDFFPLGEVPREWCDDRLMGSASVDEDYADIYSTEWIAFLRRKLADECLRLGIKDLDASILQRDAPRRITQLASLQVYERGLPGIYYRSRYGHELENWAFFEPFKLRSTKSDPIASDDRRETPGASLAGAARRRRRPPALAAIGP